MCFYDQTIYRCQDYKWGNFRGHCAKEYRMGETCGMKLVYEMHELKEKCRLCEKMDTKKRRQNAEKDKVKRWKSEGGKYKASIEKALETIESLEQEMEAIRANRDQRFKTMLGRG